MIYDRSAFTPPPCPQCGAPLDIHWLDVTSLGDSRPCYLPARLTCPANEDHDVRTAYAELDWPAGLSEDDKVWLREHGLRWAAQ